MPEHVSTRSKALNVPVGNGATASANKKASSSSTSASALASGHGRRWKVSSCDHLQSLDKKTIKDLLNNFSKILVQKREQVSLSEAKDLKNANIAGSDVQLLQTTSNDSQNSPTTRRRSCSSKGMNTSMIHSLICLHCLKPITSNQKSCSSSTKHYLAVNKEFNQLYCCVCKDYIYSSEFDAVLAYTLGKLQPGSGLRGLCNHGNTCFMNSVLQALVRIPSIRNYFLSHVHNAKCSVAHRAREKIIQGPPGVKRSPSFMRSNRRMAKRKTVNRQPVNGKQKNREENISHMNLYEETESKSRLTAAYRYAHSWDRPWADNFSPLEDHVSIPKHRLPEPTSPRPKANNGHGNSMGSPNSAQDIVPVCLACEFENFIGKVYCGVNVRQPLIVSHLLYSVWDHSNSLTGYVQQDAHEFFSFLVNAVHGHLRNEMSIENTPKFTWPFKHDNQLVKKSSECTKDINCECVMHRALGGKLCSEVECVSCGAISASFEPFFDVSLDIPSNLESPEHFPTVTSLLDNFTKTESLVEKVKCDKCGSKQEALKRMSLYRVPEVLVLQLKRFKQGLTPAECKKTNQIVKFDLDNLNIESYMTTNTSCRPHYLDLIAVIQHSGRMDSGHYIAYVRHHSHWYKCDDEYVFRVTKDEVKSSQGYLLFYRQNDTI